MLCVVHFLLLRKFAVIKPDKALILSCSSIIISVTMESASVASRQDGKSMHCKYFPLSLYGTTEGTYSAHFFRPVMAEIKTLWLYDRQPIKVLKRLQKQRK